MKNRTLVDFSGVFLFLISLIFCLIILEFVSRFMLPDTPYHNQNTEFEKKLGWIAKPNTTMKLNVTDHKNFSRIVNTSFKENGFKVWGEVNTTKTKVFIIGDSYTEASYVNDGEEYYSYLIEEFEDAEFFVYGLAGYGSLQEYLILDEFHDTIKPDIILWQFYSNDYFNNYRETEKYFYPLVPENVKPYFDGEKIYYLGAGPIPNLRKKSKLLDFIMVNYGIFLRKKALGLDNNVVSTKEEEESVEITVKIIEKAINRAKKSEFYVFNPEIKEKENMETLCERLNATCIKFGETYENSSNFKTINQEHLNIEGNKRLGKELIDYFKNNKIIKEIG